MKFSEHWLRTLVDPPIDSAELAHRLTMAGFEVEEQIVVIVARVHGLAALDRELNAVGYILPGLGDAGDRLFGTK